MDGHIDSDGQSDPYLAPCFSNATKCIYITSSILFCITCDDPIWRPSEVVSPFEGPTYLKQVNSMFCTESLHQFDIHGLVTVVGQDTQVGLTSVKGKTCLQFEVQYRYMCSTYVKDKTCFPVKSNTLQYIAFILEFAFKINRCFHQLHKCIHKWM